MNIASALTIAGRIVGLPSSIGSNGQVIGWSGGKLVNVTPTSGSGNAVSVTVDFGSGSDIATTVVTGQSWVTSSSVITATLGTPTADHPDPAEGIIEQLQVSVSDRVNGVGFTVTAHAPNWTTGTYTINCIGV